MHLIVAFQCLLITLAAVLFIQRLKIIVIPAIKNITAAVNVIFSRDQWTTSSGTKSHRLESNSKVGQDNNAIHHDLTFYKELYHKLQNLERFPEILNVSKDLLVSLLSETIDAAEGAEDNGILSVVEYSPESLTKFLRTTHDKIGLDWEEYVARRRAGAPTELFKDRQECVWWLKQISPVKYVDGAWLGHINKVSTPFYLRKVTKDAWQVMSEELGDGQSVMNHVYVFEDLMSKIAAGLPRADDIDFIHPRHGLDQVCSWRSAVAQLLISLFPHEFLPETLGFNMHFEGLTMETMKAAKEVEEMGFDAYYFILHISIDNADSGHTAIAMRAVINYLELVRETEGDVVVQKMWKRVQAGYVLSEGLCIAPKAPSKRKVETVTFPRNIREKEVINIFRAKAPVAHKIHCNNRMIFGGRTLVDWLDPKALESKQWQLEFLKALSNFKPWIRKGDGSNSKLVQEFRWGGKMFGSLTKSEVKAVCRWIDAMTIPRPQTYLSFTQRLQEEYKQGLGDHDIRSDYPVFSWNLGSESELPTSQLSVGSLPSPFFLSTPENPYQIPTPNMSKILPIWFTSQCLLECFVNIPAKTTTVMASSIVRVLRAQYGFDVEGFCVAGMDEARRRDSAGIIELGLEMMQKSSSNCPRNLKELLEQCPSIFALRMLHMSMRPMKNEYLLLGLSWAFVGLHDLVARSSFLGEDRCTLLRQMVDRERENLEICFQEFHHNKASVSKFVQGFALGRSEILESLSGVEKPCAGT